MTIKTRLNIIALLTLGTVMGFYLFLWYSTFQVDEHLNRIRQIDTFTETASELNIITEQYIAYGEERHLESWYSLYDRLQTYEKHIQGLPNLHVISNALPSINKAFNLIQDIRQNPQKYPHIEKRQRLLERASARIRSDIQLLISVSLNIAENRQESIRELQNNRQIWLLAILIPALFLTGFLIYQLRVKIFKSLQKLLKGTQRISHGVLDTQIDIKGAPELNELAEAFNSMSRRLQQLIKKERQARGKAEENEKRWEKLVEQDPNLIVIHIDGDIQFINKAGAQMMGSDDPDKLQGMSVFDLLIEPESLEKARKRVQKVQLEGDTVDYTIYKIRSLDGKERYLQAKSMPIKYYGENATQTVGLDITDHIEYENVLKKSLEEKTILLQEVHHRVKNNLAVISGLLYMQRQNTENAEVSQLLGESVRRIKSMALIHETLYSSSNLSSIPIKEYIGKLIGSIQETFDPDRIICVDISSDDFNLNVNQAMPCALIVNELVSNAFKHAFPGSNSGTVKVSVREKDGRAHFEISDNGEGLPDNTDPREAQSLGFTIINTLITQLNTELEIQSEEGTTFRFEFEKRDISGSSSKAF